MHFLVMSIKLPSTLDTNRKSWIKTLPQWIVDDPCIVDRIFVYEDQKIFLLKALTLKAFEVVSTDELILAIYHDFYRHGVLHMKEKHGNYFVIEKDCC